MSGLIASAGAMSALTAPVQDHQNPPAAHFEQKPLPLKPSMHQVPNHFAPGSHANLHNSAQNGPKFKTQNAHKGFFSKTKKQHNAPKHPQGPAHQLPSMPEHQH